ncbi:ABC transporter permease [Leptospira interrogans]
MILAGTMISKRLGRVGRFIWSGWSGLAAIFLFCVVWQIGHETYGAFILPSPLAAAQSVIQLASQEANWHTAATTVRRAFEGFLLAASCGVTAGIIAGYSAAAIRLARPLVTLILGVPPIAWIVLAMIWFGSTDGMVVTTVTIAAMPAAFIGAAEGIMTRDRGLDDMARAFGAGPWRRFSTLAIRHVTAHVFPALVLTLGTAFKVAVMAEVLSNAGGIGGGLARARSNLDVSEAMAWVLISVAALIAVEYGLVRPIHGELERWREAARPWGVRR